MDATAEPQARFSTIASTCVGPGVHLAPASQDPHEIAWWKASSDGARVVKWTCPRCHGEEYELCVLGGVWFIRRTARQTHETVRDTRREIELLWWLLVAGGAR